MTAGAGIVLYAGQRIDTGAGRNAASGLFPDALEPAVRRATRARLVDLNAVVGYSSASAGGDIIFGEELVALGGELNLYLPCERDDFIAQYVAPAGDSWIARFKRLCGLAASVNVSCEERLLGDETLVRFNNQMLQGMARLRGEDLGQPPHLLLLWSPGAPPEPGSPADFMDHWPELSRLAIIDMDELRAAEGLAGPAAIDLDEFDLLDLEFGVSPRAIRAILFADIATYTQFEDREVPLLFDFLAEAQQQVEERAKAPILINTWGDAVHAAAETAHDLADYAAALTAAVASIDPASFELRNRPRFRIALHAGPVFVGLHPLTNRSMIFGHHVNRAARIEPLAIPGAMCASQHFVALLKAEMDERADEARLTEGTYTPRYEVVYLGRKELAKQFGSEDIYLLQDTEAAAFPFDQEETMAPRRISPPMQMRLEIGSDLAEIAVVAARVEAFCALHGLGSDVAHAVNLSLDELLTNTITHGFEGADEQHIEIALSLEATTLTVQISDTGIAFDPSDAPVPDLESDIEDRQIGGLGVHFVREMMDSLSYRRHDGRNELTLTKHVHAAVPENE